MVLAIANDNQFKNFCIFAGLKDLFTNEKFKNNSKRVKNRKELNKVIGEKIKKKNIVYWVEGLLKVNVPCGPINNLKEVFNDPQVVYRGMKVPIKYGRKTVNLVGSPINLSKSPILYRKAPPKLGEDTDKILKSFLKLTNTELNKLKTKKII